MAEQPIKKGGGLWDDINGIRSMNRGIDQLVVGGIRYHPGDGNRIRI